MSAASRVAAPGVSRRDLLAASAALAGNQSDWSKERSQAFGQYAAEADAAGVTKAAIVEVSSCHGADHIAFGSNLPSTAGPLTKLVADAKTCLAALSAADRAMILAGTAKRLYPVLA